MKLLSIVLAVVLVLCLLEEVVAFPITALITGKVIAIKKLKAIKAAKLLKVALPAKLAFKKVPGLFG